MEFSLRELHGVPVLCPWNYSWPGSFPFCSGALSTTHTTAQRQAFTMQYADFRAVCLVSETSEREMWHLARLQAGKTEVEKLVDVILQREWEGLPFVLSV